MTPIAKFKLIWARKLCLVWKREKKKEKEEEEEEKEEEEGRERKRGDQLLLKRCGRCCFSLTRQVLR